MKNNNNPHSRIRKNTLQRIACVIMSAVFVTTGLPVNLLSELVDDISIPAVDLPQFDGMEWKNLFKGLLYQDNVLQASADSITENTDRSAQQINITTKRELIDYANGQYYTDVNTNGTYDAGTDVLIGYRHDDTLSIAVSVFDLTSSDNYPGIGIPDAPFAGTVMIAGANDTTDPYGDMKKITLDGVTLFNYISTDTQFINTSNVATPLLLRQSGSGSSVPLFANVVTSGSTPQTWDIVVDAPMETGGLIGSISGNPIISLSYIRSGAVTGSGAVCGSIASNASLTLSVNSSCKEIGDGSNNAATVTCESFRNVTGSSHTGGLVGSMASNSSLTINALPAFSNGRTISTTNGYAGGLVGYNDQGTVSFGAGVNYTDANSNTITGTGGAGGVFGYYVVPAGTVQTIDASVYSITGTNTVTASNGSSGGFIGVIENNGTSTSASSVTIDGGTFCSTLNAKTASGGVIGQIRAADLKNSITIQNVSATSIRTNRIYGGVFGNTGQKSQNYCVYIRIDGSNTISVNGTAGTSGGIGGNIDKSFLDVAGENTITGSICAGVLYSASAETVKINNANIPTPSSVLRLAGKTDLSGATTSSANVIQARNNALVYALGIGNNYAAANGSTPATGWSFYRPAIPGSLMDDVNGWGQVVRLVNDGTANQTLEAAGVVTYDSTEHTVTLNGIAPSSNKISMANSAEFAKVALNVKHNTTGQAKSTGAFRTTSDLFSSDVLNNPNITLEFTGDISLAGTGLTGFTRDDTSSLTFTGKLDGKDHTIDIAVGEAYGYQGTTLASSITDMTTWGNTGANVAHNRASLFNMIGAKDDAEVATSTGCKISDLTLDGEVRLFTNAESKVGALAVIMVGNAEVDGVTVQPTFNLYNSTTKDICCGGFFALDGDWVSNANANPKYKTLTITNSETNITVNAKGLYEVKGLRKSCIGGVFGRTEIGTDIDADGLEIGGTYTIETSSDLRTVGGLVGLTYFLSAGTIYPNTFTLKNVTVDDLDISYTNTGDCYYTGGLLGGVWRNTDVIIGSSTTDGLTVKNSSISLNCKQCQTFGGLVTQATGYWQVNGLKYEKTTIPALTVGTNSKAPTLFGLIVGEGQALQNDTTNNAGDYRIYLETTASNAYTIDSGAISISTSPTAFDEFVGKTMTDLTNRQGAVSIRTTNAKLSMASGSDNSYQPQTDYGKSIKNPNTRYYYNLDYLMDNYASLSTTNGYQGGARLLLWSMNRYLASNILNDTTLQTEHSGTDFTQYATSPTGSSSENLECNLEYLSWYPIDLDSSASLNYLTVKLNNTDMEDAHGERSNTVNSTSYSILSTVKRNSQHYLMHASLFKNVSAGSTLAVSDMVLQGAIPVYTNISNSADTAVGSGALICGTISGNATDGNAGLTINGLSLDGIKVNTTGGVNALLVKTINDYTTISITGVSTTDGYNYDSDNDDTDDSTNTAAAYLIGDANGSQMSITFSDMRLDSRKTVDAVSNTTAKSSLNDCYHTFRSIFTSSTLLNSLTYTTGSGSSAVYNYNYNEDWTNATTAVHHVTYGWEVKYSAENVDEEHWYLDKHAEGAVYTSPESGNAGSAYDFASARFLPYVATAYNAATNKHEIAVNLLSVGIQSGCGTYNDPYIIEDVTDENGSPITGGAMLSSLAVILSGEAPRKGFSLYIDKDYLYNANGTYKGNSPSINFERWDSGKSDGSGHLRYEYDGSQFVCVEFNSSTNTWAASTTYTQHPSEATVRSYLESSYYQIKGSSANNHTITLPTNFIGLGGTTAQNAFRGVIVGEQYDDSGTIKNVKIINPSTAPFVNVSNGCVIKDVDLNVTATAIELTNSSITTAAKFDYTSPCPYYGGVIGEIMGGDNVIDNVNMTYGATSSASSTTISLKTGNTDSSVSYKYVELIPVGGYVGVVVYGGLVFRNMSAQSSTTLGSLNVHSYKYDGTQLYTNCMSDSQMAHLYVNPIVGRVVNGYVINEVTSSYTYTEATSTLKNSIKNYSIPNVKSNTSNKITFTQTIEPLDTINVPDGQSLFLLSCITQSMSGNAGSASGNYNVPLSYGNNCKTVHHGEYTAVGSSNSSETDFTSYASTDNTASLNSASVPYLIYHYTTAYDGVYPARAITGINTNYHYLTLSNSGSDYTYNLPQCFRGIGLIYSLDTDDNIRHNLLDLYGMNGNGHTININTVFNNKSSAFDSYYRYKNNAKASNLGLGLFNDLYMNLPTVTTETESNKSAHAESVITNTTNALYNFKISGLVQQVQYDNAGATGTSAAPSAGLIGYISYSSGTAERVYNIWNVELNNLTVKGESYVGGFLSVLPDTIEYFYINGCSANNLSLETSSGGAGAILGYTSSGNARPRLFVNTFSDTVNTYKVSVKTTENARCGGLTGSVKAAYVTLRNINITPMTDGYIGKISLTSSKSDKPYSGGAVGYVTDTKILLDNVNVKDMNIYGYFSGGLIGYSLGSSSLRIYNSSVKGKTVSGDTNTYQILAYNHSGGIVGDFSSTGAATLNCGTGTSFKNHIDGCLVSDYTISQTQSGNFGVGGIIGYVDGSKNICNSKVDTLTIKANGTNMNNGEGGVVGRLNNTTINMYNLVLNDLSFDANTYVNGKGIASAACYGILVGNGCGVVSGTGSSVVKAVGITLQGNNVIIPKWHNTSGAKMIFDSQNRPIEFWLGRQAKDTNAATTEIVTNRFNSSNCYIIPADYEGASLSSLTKGAMLSDQTLATSVSKAVPTDDNFPYASSSPKYTLGTSGKILTGDGVSPNKAAATDIIAQYNQSATYGAKSYSNVAAADIEAYNALVADGKLVTNDDLLNGIPVIIMDSTGYDYDAKIKAYLRILTNTSYAFDCYESNNNTIKGRYTITVLNCNIDGRTPVNSTTLKYMNTTESVNSKLFSMDSSVFDSGTAGQFSLIDVQFFSPSETSKVAYHLYVPVITKKLYYYGFKTTVFSGTQYYSSKYTGETGTKGFNSENPKVLMENYNTPVTQYLSWTYPTATLISDVLSGGYGLDWHYEKAIKINVNYGGTLPTGTTFVLIDKNNGNKEYYYTVDGSESYSSNAVTIDFDSFRTKATNVTISNYEALFANEDSQFTKVGQSGLFVETSDSDEGVFTVWINGTETSVKLADEGDSDTFDLIETVSSTQTPTIVDFQSLVTSQLTFTKTQSTGEGDKRTFVQGTGSGEFTVKIGSESITLRPANAGDSDADTFDLATVTKDLNEDYYLTINMPKASALYHQLEITSADPLAMSKNGKMSSKASSLHSVQVNFANLFSNDIKVSTVDDNTNVEMNNTNDDVVVHTTSIIKFATNSSSTINEIKNMIDTNSIPVYHSVHVFMNKRSEDQGSAVKMIGEIAGITKTTENNTITAYSTYDYNNTSINTIIESPAALSYSDITGSSITNFFEVREVNSNARINLASYLTSGGTGVAPTVVVDSCYKITYTHTGIITQFPEREAGDDSSNIGTYVSAASSLAYDPDDTTYSSNVSETNIDDVRLYYRYEMTDANLSFNVYSEESDEVGEIDGSLLSKANDQLGINIFDDGTDTNAIIQTKGIYDASQLSALSKNNLKVRWTLQLQCKQDNYATNLVLRNYLNSISLKSAYNGVPLASLTATGNTGTLSNDGTTWYYQDNRNVFEESGEENQGLFDVYLDFDVKTGSDLQAVANAFYSNYRIVLTGTLCEGSSSIDGTGDDDYIIYTNARLDPTFVDMAS